MTTEAEINLLKRWRTNCNRSQIANYDAANRYSWRNYKLGVPTIILSTVVGTSVFAALGDKIDATYQITVGFLSVTAAVLAALQTFLKWGELAAKHSSTAAEYGSVKRQIDQILAAESSLTEPTLRRVPEQMDTLAKEGPEVPRDIWKKARNTRPTVGSESIA